MRPRTRHVLLAALLAVSACVPPTKPAPAPPPAPPPAPAPMPTPTPSPTYTNWEAPAPSDWMDAPQTPGDWSYAAGAATFGTPERPLFIVRCSAPGVTVQLAYVDGFSQAMTIRTEAMNRTLPTMAIGTPRAGSAPAQTIASVAADDSLLDAMAYSKGRFAVELAGAPTLYLPAWPEVARVIEDCRSG